MHANAFSDRPRRSTTSRPRRKLSILAALMLAAGGSLFDVYGEPAPAATVTEALSAETRAVLVAEMQQLTEAMSRIHRALITGDHATVARTAQQVHDSFVLAQELGESQRKEIRERLPGDFIARDQAFHQLASRLAEAGKDHDPATQRFWFGEMTRACQSCHREFAAGRFPGLADESMAPAEH